MREFSFRGWWDNMMGNSIILVRSVFMRGWMIHVNLGLLSNFAKQIQNCKYPNNPKWTGGSRVPNLTVAQVSYVNDKSHIYASKDKLEMSPGLNWVNEYNFVAGLQTWPNLNSQQRKSGNRKLGWIEFSSAVSVITDSSEEKVRPISNHKSVD